jgi:hypothetical protein
MRSAIAVTAAVWIASASTCLAQNCVVSGGTNYGSIEQHCTVVGPTKLVFEPAIAEELVRKIPPGRPIRLMSVGSAGDQAVATQYQQFLQSHGFQIERTTIGMMAPPPDHPISIQDGGNLVTVLIAPSAR